VYGFSLSTSLGGLTGNLSGRWFWKYLLEISGSLREKASWVELPKMLLLFTVIRSFFFSKLIYQHFYRSLGWTNGTRRKLIGGFVKPIKGKIKWLYILICLSRLGHYFIQVNNIGDPLCGQWRARTFMKKWTGVAVSLSFLSSKNTMQNPANLLNIRVPVFLEVLPLSWKEKERTWSSRLAVLLTR